MARPASTGSVPLHPHARLLGQPNRVLLQHSQQAGLGAQRPTLQTGAKEITQPLYRQLQRNLQSVYLDQRARASATNHRDDQGIPGSSPQKTSPASSQAEEIGFYKGLTGRRTSSRVRVLKRAPFLFSEARS